MRNPLKALLLLLTALPLSAQSVFYLSPRISALHVSGNPNIGDVGRVIDDNLPQASYGLHAGWNISPRFTLELRYTGFARVEATKISPHWPIFPGEEVLLPVERKYRFGQHTTLFSAAAPVRLLQEGRWSLRVSPLIHIEFADVDIHEIVDVMPTEPDGLGGPQYIPIKSREETNLRFGAELVVNYELGETSFAQVHYTFSNLSNFKAHQLGAGLGVRF